jgi:hypothetical protein
MKFSNFTHKLVYDLEKRLVLKIQEFYLLNFRIYRFFVPKFVPDISNSP